MFEFLISLLFAVMPTCQTEDSTGCAWDAQSQGNGQGVSFIAVTEDVRIEVTR